MFIYKLNNENLENKICFVTDEFRFESITKVDFFQTNFIINIKIPNNAK